MFNLTNVCKTYNQGQPNEFTALKDINIHIGSGEFVSVMGESGSGKSTLLNLIAGFDNPTSGDVVINNENISKMSENQRAVFRNKSIGFVFQSFCLLSDLNVLENVYIPLLVQGVSKSEAKKRAMKYLELVNLQDKSKNKPEELSGGQKQRVAIARALAVEPSVILADEPTGNLDSSNGKEILELLGHLNKKDRKTILMVTHSQEAAGYTSRTICLKDGEIL